MAYLLLVELFSERGLLILQGTWVQEIFTSWPICQGITKAAFFSVGQSQTKDENDCWRLSYNSIYLKSSWNEKDLIDVTAVPFSVGFLLLVHEFWWLGFTQRFFHGNWIFQKVGGTNFHGFTFHWVREDKIFVNLKLGIHKDLS